MLLWAEVRGTRPAFSPAKLYVRVQTPVKPVKLATRAVDGGGRVPLRHAQLEQAALIC